MSCKSRQGIIKQGIICGRLNISFTPLFLLLPVTPLRRKIKFRWNFLFCPKTYISYEKYSKTPSPLHPPLIDLKKYLINFCVIFTTKVFIQIVYHLLNYQSTHPNPNPNLNLNPHKIN